MFGIFDVWNRISAVLQHHQLRPNGAELPSELIAVQLAEHRSRASAHGEVVDDDAVPLPPIEGEFLNGEKDRKRCSDIYQMLKSINDDEQIEWDVFLSHYQGKGSDQCGILSRDLKQRGFKVWFDQEAVNLNEDGMMVMHIKVPCAPLNFVLFWFANIRPGLIKPFHYFINWGLFLINQRQQNN